MKCDDKELNMTNEKENILSHFKVHYIGTWMDGFRKSITNCTKTDYLVQRMRVQVSTRCEGTELTQLLLSASGDWGSPSKRNSFLPR
jgi:allantoicase